MNQDYFREAPPILQEFLGYMDNIRGLSSLSVDEYYLDLRTFFRFILKERGLVRKRYRPRKQKPKKPEPVKSEVKKPEPAKQETKRSAAEKSETMKAKPAKQRTEKAEVRKKEPEKIFAEEPQPEEQTSKQIKTNQEKQEIMDPEEPGLDGIDISCVDLELVRSITYTDILMFLNYCQSERSNRSSTRARKTSTLKVFFRYLTVKVNKLTHNPTDALDTPKKAKTMPKYLTLEQTQQLLQAVDGNDKERDYCILIFFLNCGMRNSELCGINLSDINSEHRLTIRGKGNKERILYLNDACMEALESYLKVRPVNGIDDPKALFISKKKCRFTPKGIQHLLERYLKKIGLDGQGYSPHKLRHTAATLMYQKGGVDVRTLQAILGHTSLSTTQIYTHIADRQIIEGLKANPLAHAHPGTGDSENPSDDSQPKGA